MNRKNPIELFGFHKGQWVPEHDPRLGKEFMVASNKIKLLVWETKLKKWNYQHSSSGGGEDAKKGEFVEATFNYGKAKGKCCSTAKKEDVISCLNPYIRGKGVQKYQFPFFQCRARAKSALSACCLEV
ncbi:MAG: hypothetical protein RBR08_06255 [Desulforegulaceae bacterium]|nr:hypothetical protein [Desulforegulaceae bacterium]